MLEPIRLRARLATWGVHARGISTWGESGSGSLVPGVLLFTRCDDRVRGRLVGRALACPSHWCRSAVVWASTLGIFACSQGSGPPGSARDLQAEPGWRFADGERLSKVQVQGSALGPGDTLRIQWSGSQKVNKGLVWGLAPSQDAGWQHYPRESATRWVSSRTKWWSLSSDEQRSAELAVPEQWQDRSVTLLAYRKKANGELWSVQSGPRLPSADPPKAEAAKLVVAAVASMQPAPMQIEVPSVSNAMRVDGRDKDWPKDLKSYAFVDSLNGNAIDTRGTQVRFTWDQKALYIFADMQDPDLWAPDENRDAPLYRKEALELFVGSDASNQGYLELQISAANVVFDARYRRHRQGDRTWNGRWEHAVQRRGTLKDRRDQDEGWSAELALSWEELCSQTRLHCPVMPGTRIRVNLFRVESPRPRVQEGTALSATYRPDFHAMDRAATLILSP